eukprot:CAMPEP_0197326058 /NCGR_PEP_ID=MMETSP0892-20130614/1257_1 /TAXON_ID=44058 ORGANISM="Aureoumbra lagunensis, Strain CCMP1510" /NCGR_SAMPLE_ID=MMETSP0892 /ASSEMBLY_ACC=CAM_ASM_000538 /LENGTH=202 /DNA_ID=CAMNT_0042819845 /DNA_START=60 /DNA_END=669 /DNA_ORIENTATION=+
MESALGEASDYGNWSSGGARSMQVADRDLPNQLKMKYRTGDQLPPLEKQTLKTEVLRRESQVKKMDLLLQARAPIVARPDLLVTKEIFEDDILSKKYNDKDDQSSESNSDSDDNSSDSDDDDDDQLAIARELEKIRKEREEERIKKEAQKQADEQNARETASLTSNPLLHIAPSGAVKRKWNDDVVFRHQARGIQEPKKTIH